MITVSDVSLSFGGQMLFKDVNLLFTAGNCYGVIGANGAGKTTLMDIICGITAKTDGTVTYFGETDNADKGNVKERIGYCASQAMFPANWKVRDILKFGGMRNSLSL